MSMQTFKVEGNRDQFIKRLFFLAWQACGGTSGLGFLQARDDADENKVFDNVLRAGDYPGVPHHAPRLISSDYVFGRMMKLNVYLVDDDSIGMYGEWRRDYQGFSGKYKTPEELFEATKASLAKG